MDIEELLSKRLESIEKLVISLSERMSGVERESVLKWEAHDVNSKLRIDMVVEQNERLFKQMETISKECASRMDTCSKFSFFVSNYKEKEKAIKDTKRKVKLSIITAFWGSIFGLFIYGCKVFVQKLQEIKGSLHL